MQMLNITENMSEGVHQIDFNLEHCTGVDANEINDDMEATAYQLKLLPTRKLA
jgi:hypothetical protein